MQFRHSLLKNFFLKKYLTNQKKYDIIYMSKGNDTNTKSAASYNARKAT